MREIRFVHVVVGLCCATTSAFAADRKLDPDPAFLPKARTLAWAGVDAHYDMMNDKVHFPWRFIACAAKMTAARSDGRALPVPRPELEKIIAEYRSLASELHAYLGKTRPGSAANSIDWLISDSAEKALDVMKELTPKLGAARLKALNTEHLEACRLNRAWYEVQNGLRQPVPAADQPKISALHLARLESERTASARPPGQAATAPSPVQGRPAAVAPVTRPNVVAPSAGANIPPPGPPVQGLRDQDKIIGPDLVAPVARAEFVGRPLWSALAECSARFLVIQERVKFNTAENAERFRRQAGYIMWADRNQDFADTLAVAGAERNRFARRSNALWDDINPRHAEQPTRMWIASCNGLATYANAYADIKGGARTAEYNRRQEERKAQFERENEARRRALQQQPANVPASSYGSAAPSVSPGLRESPSAASAREHQGVMQQYERENRQIRQETRAIERRYGLGR